MRMNTADVVVVIAVLFQCARLKSSTTTTTITCIRRNSKSVVLNHGVATHLCVASFFCQIIYILNYQHLVHVIQHLFTQKLQFDYGLDILDVSPIFPSQNKGHHLKKVENHCSKQSTVALYLCSRCQGCEITTFFS